MNQKPVYINIGEKVTEQAISTLVDTLGITIPIPIISQFISMGIGMATEKPMSSMQAFYEDYIIYTQGWESFSHAWEGRYLFFHTPVVKVGGGYSSIQGLSDIEGKKMLWNNPPEMLETGDTYWTSGYPTQFEVMQFTDKKFTFLEWLKIEGAIKDTPVYNFIRFEMCKKDTMSYQLYNLWYKGNPIYEQ